MSTSAAASQNSKDETDIRAVFAAIHEAHRNKDAAAIAQHYTHDAAVFDLAPPLTHRGIDLHEKQAWLETWDGPVNKEPGDFNITVRGDSAFCHGFYRLGGNKKGVSEPIRFWMRATVGLLREGDAWKIVHEHESVPFYMDGSMRPAFDLKP